MEITRAVKLHPKPPVSVTTTSAIGGKMNLQQKFSSIGSICFRFHFQDDLLDAGEELIVYFSDGTGAGPNRAEQARSEVVLCVAEPLRSLLLDGKEDISIKMGEGSVTIGSLSITVTGVRNEAWLEEGRFSVRIDYGAGVHGIPFVPFIEERGRAVRDVPRSIFPTSP